MYFNIDHEQHSHRAQVQHFTLSSSEYSKLICLSCSKLQIFFHATFKWHS